MKWALASAVLVVLIASGCARTPPTPSPSPVATASPTGGTLRVAMDLQGFDDESTDEDARSTDMWDPQRMWAPEPFEIFRCCLLRTLMSYNGRSVAEGGAVLRPDLAAGHPTISADGLTWTFTLKPGVNYAPPMSDKTVVAADFVRAIERGLRRDPRAPDEDAPFGTYAFLLGDVIVGGHEFTEGRASSISGLETRDDQTLTIHLVRPTGDLGALLSMPVAAPIPAGAADGHDNDYGLHLVGSGPYMIEGSDTLQPGAPVDQQPAVSGYIPGESLTLIRNPSWYRSDDSLRLASADRIEIVNATGPALLEQLRDGSVDLSIGENVEPAELAAIKSDAALSGRLHFFPAQHMEWIMMNVAVRPFDDLHVRRAVQFVVNKAAVAAIMDPTAVVQTHAIPDPFENGLLADYDPYETAGHAGSIVLAKAEMAQSAYDTDHDGVCDNPACADVYAPVRLDPRFQDAATSVAASLSALGIHLNTQMDAEDDPYFLASDPTNHVAMVITAHWFSDYLSGASWFGPLVGSGAIGQGGSNLSLIGATDKQLVDWGYSVKGVPSLDAKIEACIAQTGNAQFACWAEADQYLMERVAAWVPVSTRQWSRLTSDGLDLFVFGAALGAPALDQMQVSGQ